MSAAVCFFKDNNQSHLHFVSTGSAVIGRISRQLMPVVGSQSPTITRLPSENSPTPATPKLCPLAVTAALHQQKMITTALGSCRDIHQGAGLLVESHTPLPTGTLVLWTATLSWNTYMKVQSLTGKKWA